MELQPDYCIPELHTQTFHADGLQHSISRALYHGFEAEKEYLMADLVGTVHPYAKWFHRGRNISNLHLKQSGMRCNRGRDPPQRGG